MEWIDSIAVFSFLFIILFIGLVASKHVNNNEDYLLAGSRVGPWPLALSMAATDLGGAGIVGVMALSYTIGITGSLWDVCAVPALFVLAYFVPKLFTGQNVTTVPELFGKRYDERTRTIVALVQIVGATLTITAQNVVTSIVIHTLTGIAFQYALIISTLVFIIYTTAGGLISVIWTDIFAYLALVIGTLIAVVFFVGSFGGITEIAQAVPSSYWEFNGLTGMTISAWIGMNLFLYTTSQPYLQRVFAARSKSAVKFAYIFTGVNFLVYGVLISVLGILAFALSATTSNPEYGSVAIIYDNLPVGLRGIVLIAFLAATMSTSSSYLNGCASIFTIDIYKRILNKKASQIQCLNVARLSTIAIAALSLIASFIPVSVIDIIVFANLVYSATIFFPLVLGYTSKTVNAAGAFYSIVSGLVIGSLYAAGIYEAFNHYLLKIHPIFIASATSLIVLLLVSKLTQNKYSVEDVG